MTVQPLERELQALRYERVPFNYNELVEVQALVMWLEDKKIRAWEVEERKGLRNFDSKEWFNEFHRYLEDLGCPRSFSDSFTAKERLAVLQWLVGYAVSNEYSDNVQEYERVAKSMLKQVSQPSASASQEITQEAKDLLREIGTLLYHPARDDFDGHMRILAKVVKAKFDKRSPKSKEQVLSVLNAPLGFDTGDKTVNKAARILRMLYIEDLREFQTAINDIISLMQEYTARPKTNAKLGKVGY